MSCLYLEINPLLVALFVHIFSHSVDCLHFVYGFLCCVKLASLIRSYFLVFAFISFAWETDLRKHAVIYVR